VAVVSAAGSSAGRKSPHGRWTARAGSLDKRYRLW